VQSEKKVKTRNFNRLFFEPVPFQPRTGTIYNFRLYYGWNHSFMSWLLIISIWTSSVLRFRSNNATVFRDGVNCKSVFENRKCQKFSGKAQWGYMRSNGASIVDWTRFGKSWPSILSGKGILASARYINT